MSDIRPWSAESRTLVSMDRLRFAIVEHTARRDFTHRCDADCVDDIWDWATYTGANTHKVEEGTGTPPPLRNGDTLHVLNVSDIGVPTEWRVIRRPDIASDGSATPRTEASDTP